MSPFGTKRIGGALLAALFGLLAIRASGVNGENCSRGYLWEEENVNTYLKSKNRAGL